MPAPYRDVVVFIPGILGSTLAKKGKPVWGTGAQSILKAAAGGLDMLALPEFGSSKPDLGDEISVTGLTPNIEIVPGFWKLGGYSRTSTFLGDLPGLIRGKNYFDFPYDWRRDNRLAAQRLKDQAEGWLRDWVRESGQPDAKLVFVAHSMGGLVARYYVECLEGWRSTRMFIAVGSPFRGSGKALDFLVNGVSSFAGLGRRLDPLRQLDSLYQLLPIYPFVCRPHDKLRRLAELDYLPVDRDRISWGLAFHEEIEAAVAANEAIEDYRLAARTLRTVIGINQPTIQAAIWDEGELHALYHRDGKDNGGDSTVPRPSATPVFANEDVAMFIANSHAVMAADDKVLTHIGGMLASPDLDLTKYRDLANSLALTLDDVAAAGAPIPIAVQVIGKEQAGVTACIERDGDTVARIALQSVGDAGFNGEVTLPAGDYTIRVNADGVPEVADVIAVFG